MKLGRITLYYIDLAVSIVIVFPPMWIAVTFLRILEEPLKQFYVVLLFLMKAAHQEYNEILNMKEMVK